MRLSVEAESLAWGARGSRPRRRRSSPPWHAVYRRLKCRDP